jgi:hypothetical protein
MSACPSVIVFSIFSFRSSHIASPLWESATGLCGLAVSLSVAKYAFEPSIFQSRVGVVPPP